MNKIKFFLSLIVLLALIISCSTITDKLSGDKLYFVEQYTTEEIGKSDKFEPGNLTVMLKLSKPIGVTSVNINITDLEKNEVVKTLPFTVDSEWDYIHFDDVSITDPGKYRVSALKEDGTVIASNDDLVIAD